MKNKQNYTDLQSRTIEWLRFPLVVAVVFIHSFGEPKEYVLPLQNISTFSGVDIYNLTRICFSHVLTHIAVPVFFVISGYLFFYNVKEFTIRGGYYKKLKSRFQTLIIPFILWNLISILVTVLAFPLKGEPLSNILVYFEENGWLHMFWDCKVWAEDKTNWLGLPAPYTGPLCIPLWFLRDLIVVVLFTPIIYWMIRRLRHFFILVLTFCYISDIWPSIHGLTITSMLFFSLGAYFSIQRKNLINEFRRVKIVSYICGTLLLIATIYYDGLNTKTGNLIYPFWVIVGVCATFNIASFLIETYYLKVNTFLSKSSFFIFASHTIFILRICSVVCSKVLYGDTWGILIVRYFVTPFLAVGVCLLLYWLMGKFTPKLLGVLTGNRK